MKHSIGDYVVVSHEMGRTGAKHVCWVPWKLKGFRLGQVIGLVTKYSGTIEDYHSCSFDVDPNYFRPTKTHTFWQVKFGLLNKPVFVREKDMRLARVDEVEELPKLYTRQCPWSDKDKKRLSEDSKDWPRNSKGRWIHG